MKNYCRDLEKAFKYHSELILGKDAEIYKLGCEKDNLLTTIRRLEGEIKNYEDNPDYRPHELDIITKFRRENTDLKNRVTVLMEELGNKIGFYGMGEDMRTLESFPESDFFAAKEKSNLIKASLVGGGSGVADSQFMPDGNFLEEYNLGQMLRFKSLLDEKSKADEDLMQLQSELNVVGQMNYKLEQEKSNLREQLDSEEQKIKDKLSSLRDILVNSNSGSQQNMGILELFGENED
jgi:hypothetical protein